MAEVLGGPGVDIFDLASGIWAELLEINSSEGAAGSAMGYYRDYCDTLGRKVRVEAPAEVFEGTATEIGDDGELIVSTAAGQHRTVYAGDVIHLRAE